MQILKPHANFFFQGNVSSAQQLVHQLLRNWSALQSDVSQNSRCKLYRRVRHPVTQSDAGYLETCTEEKIKNFHSDRHQVAVFCYYCNYYGYIQCRSFFMKCCQALIISCPKKKKEVLNLLLEQDLLLVSQT